MGPVWGGAKTHRTLSAHRCGATALCYKTHGSVVEEVGGVPHPTVVDHRPSAARPSGETGRLAAPERRCVILLPPVRLLSWMDRSHRIGRRASPSVGDATGLVTQKLYADGRGSCYTYTDDGNLATRTWARGVTTSYTYDVATDNTWRSFIQLKRSGNQEWSLNIKGTFGPYYYSDIKLSRMTRTDKYVAQFITLYDAPGGAIYEKVVVEY